MKHQKRSHALIAIGNVYVSEELTQEFFACDIARCKGACCVEGELGAPLEKNELPLMEEVYPAVKSYLPAKGVQAIERQGPYVKDFTGSFSTPLVEGKECAYTVFDEKGVAQCGIELAHREGKTSFRKPISCHLYPIRISELSDGEALNYDRWNICNAACARGKDTAMRVYEFVKEALIRKYGTAFYEALDQLVSQRKNMNP